MKILSVLNTYKVFKDMLDSGVTPNDWRILLSKHIETDELQQDKQLSELQGTNDTGS